MPTVLAAAVVAAATATRGAAFQPADQYRLSAVRDVQISPDASRIAYTVEMSDRPGRPYQVGWVIDVASGARVRLGGAHATATHPRWSPDGALVACHVFDEGALSLAVAKPDGSPPVVLARILTTNHPLPSAGEDIAWSPDGARVAFVSAVAPARGEAPTDPLVITRYLYKPTASEGDTRIADERRLHVFVVEVASRRVTALTEGDGYEHSIAWSPRGDEVLFVANREPDPDRRFNDDVFAVRVADRRVRRLSATPSAEYTPVWSPDGAKIAFLGTTRPLTSSETTLEDTHVWIATAEGAERRDAGATVDDRQENVGWAPDGAALYATVQERGSERLYRFPLAGPAQAVAPPAGRSGVVHAWSVARDGTLAYALGDASGPADLYVQPRGGAARRLTDVDHDLIAERARAEVEAFTFSSFDGTPIECFLTRPGGLKSGAKSPLIVSLHGGPHGQQGDAFDLKSQVYAGLGWATLMVNYRGSTGYGQKLTDAIFGDQDGGEARDVLAAVDAALARDPSLDPDRLAVEGTSYGGQLVDWLVTQTGRFRAAAALSGISNLVSFNYTAYYHDYLAVEYGSYPHENGLMDRLWERSPLRFVGRVKTPVLLLHGENDNDVPIGEAEQFYIALEDAGVDTAFVRYPREGHGLRESAHVVDALERRIAWYRRAFDAARR